MFLCVWQSLPIAWCDALRADISRGVPHAGLHKLHDSDSPQRKFEKASAENVLKQRKACGGVTDRCCGPFSSQQRCQQNTCSLLFAVLLVSLIHSELKTEQICAADGTRR